jgi:DNA-directed RNA polymerase subunit M/transcription elongation factor TFIIS
MMKVASLRSSNYTTCKKCGNLLVAPEFSESFSEEQVVIDYWSCVNCGNQFETEVAAESKFERNVAQELHPTLLVA